VITVGIDEVGRGCWAGPLVAGAVVLSRPVAGLTDSKLLTKLRREQLATEIERSATSGLGWVAPAEIDEIGLTESVRLAMRRALEQIADAPDEIIIDGNFNFLADVPRTRAIIRADFSVPAVSAASIVAKVARDRWMCEQAATDFPHYGFEKHVGYGTAAHVAALKKLGVTDIHRRSFKPVHNFLAPPTSERIV
jgi:ribonuclease HII